MKVGTDGVLLGAWADVEGAQHILDIGTGSGLIALMLAQRSEALICAIDIDADAVAQARENFTNSTWSHRMIAEEISLQHFASKSSNQYDLIVSNPPYFANSLKSPDVRRSAARHNNELTHQELLKNAKSLLNETGRICLILPVIEGLQCVDFAQRIQLFCNKLVYVHPKPNSAPKRLLLEFSFMQTERIISTLEIETNERHHLSTVFKQLVKNYYLKLK